MKMGICRTGGKRQQKKSTSGVPSALSTNTATTLSSRPDSTLKGNKPREKTSQTMEELKLLMRPIVSSNLYFYIYVIIIIRRHIFS